MLHLYTSNRMEALLERLAGVVSEPLASPFLAEMIVVQSLGMRRWLSHELATRLGICANVAFPFPQSAIHTLSRLALPHVPESKAFERANLTWRIMQLLPALLANEEFAELRRYLSGERIELKRYQLARKIAETFDQYFAYRPEMIRDWDAGRERHWQAVLWRAIVDAAGGDHPAALAKQLADALPTAELAGISRRISVFGISSLPPFYLHLFNALAARIDVHLFLLEPTPEWWGDIRSPREQTRLRRKLPGADLHLERGNGLLASLGKSGRDFLEGVFELDPARHEEPFVAPDEGTLLGAVQSDIFSLREGNPEHASAVGADGSIQVHSCHSPMREMEVLHDQLLALFERDPRLLPRDILVAMPDVESYAPFIEAVFDTLEQEPLRIPFSIADRGARCASGLIDTFLRILELAGTRLTANSVMALLEDAAVRRRFECEESDLETLRSWVRRTAIRWGIDGPHRAECGLPEFEQNSWRAGLDRLLLGYALPAGGERLFAGVLPFDEIEGSLAGTLGNFAEFCERLFETVREIGTPRPLGAWQFTLRAVLDRFFHPVDAAEFDALQLRRVIDGLGETAAVSGYAEPVPLDVLRAHLASALEAEERNTGFLAGRVTFCALKPMRSIPFKVICLAGMDGTAFPRHATSPGFDRIAEKPRRGDRTLRDDDRYLFLETLLSARGVLYISHVGQSIRDNSPLPPSVLVSELLDYVEARCGAEVRAALVTKHPLQAFSPRYFSGSPLFSHSVENCRAAAVARGDRREPAPFLAEGLAEPEEEWRTVQLRQLVRFFQNPARFFLRERLGITLWQDDETLEDREPFEIAPLTRYALAQDLTARHLAGETLPDLLPLARAAGELPPGEIGESIYRGLSSEVEAFAENVRAVTAGGASPPVPIEITLGRWQLLGLVEGMHSDTLVRYRCAKLTAKDLLACWIPHLALNHAGPCETVLVARDDEVVRFAPVADAGEMLRGSLALYGAGLCAPLRFFPATSLKFARGMLAADGKKDPRVEARKVWEGSQRERGECEDAAFDLAFRKQPEVLNEEWERIALEVFRPLLEHSA